MVATVPLTVLVRLLRGFDTRRLEEKLAKIKYRSMLLAAFEFDQPRTLPYRTLIFPEADFRFNRLFEQNEYSRETVSAGRSVVVADITMPHGDARFREADATILSGVETDLRRLRYVATGHITDRLVKRLEYAYSVPDLESRRAMAEVLHEVKPISNLHLLGRFAVGEYDNSDYAIDNGLHCGALLTGRISRLEYLCKRGETRGRLHRRLRRAPCCESG